MKKALDIDEKLFDVAKQACRATTDSDTVRLGLEALVATPVANISELFAALSPARDVRRREKTLTARRGSA